MKRFAYLFLRGLSKKSGGTNPWRRCFKTFGTLTTCSSFVKRNREEVATFLDALTPARTESPVRSTGASPCIQCQKKKGRKNVIREMLRTENDSQTIYKHRRPGEQSPSEGDLTLTTSLTPTCHIKVPTLTLLVLIPVSGPLLISSSGSNYFRQQGLLLMV